MDICNISHEWLAYTNQHTAKSKMAPEDKKLQENYNSDWKLYSLASLLSYNKVLYAHKQNDIEGQENASKLQLWWINAISRRND
jgi:hypothetical protein